MGFTFKKFHITQEHTAMKVGTDGVLLGAWAQGGQRILDVGTGTGLIALMMAQRFPTALIDAVEIDEEALMDAHYNISQSPYASRVNVIKSSLQNYQMPQQDKTARRLYDSIVSNPPYFVNSLKNPSQRRATARHTDSLSFTELMHHAARLLKDRGTLSVIIPSETKSVLQSEAVINGLSTTKIVTIKTKTSKPDKRCLMEFRKQEALAPEENTEVLMNNDGERSDWYRLLTKDFYIR